MEQSLSAVLAQTYPTAGVAFAGVSGNEIFWTGVGFAAFLMFVFTYIVLKGLKSVGLAEYTVLRVLAAVFAGAASGFISGGAMVNFQIGTPGTQVAALGTAGFAMAILIWWQFPGYPAPTPPAPPAVGGTSFSPPPGATFSSTIDGLAMAENAVAVFTGFSGSELSAPLEQRRIKTTTTVEAMELVGSITSARGAVRPYTVTFSAGKYSVERT